jgi:glyoxylase-like metal-dependent hydrolase (beta-lactamase superfamily II)
MHVHHLNCISSCPLGGKLFDGRTPSLLRRGELTCHCLLVETNDGLVLVDTGFGLRDVANPQSRLSTFFLFMLKPDFREEMTAVRQIERLGFKASDVRHILMSHLDFDHAGGLDDFPQATVHMLEIERDYALAQKTWLDRQRFRPQQWSTRGNWTVHRGGAADAYFFHTEMDWDRPRCTPGLAFYQWMMEKDRAARLQNQARLCELCRSAGSELTVFCSHDPFEFEKLAGRSPGIPAEQLLVC